MDKGVLVLTTLDYTVERNQRCQHVAKAMARKYGGAVVIAKHRNLSVKSFERFRKQFPSIRVYREGQVKVYDLNPLLNQPIARPYPLIGVLSEVFVVLCMLFLYLTNIRRSFSLCYAEGPWEMLVALVLKAFGRVNRIIYGDIDYVPAFQVRPIRVQITRAIENFTLKRADLITCTGSLLAEKRRRDLGVEPIVTHNGVNFRAFSAGSVKEKHAPAIIYFGNFEERYSGLSIALEAFSEIREQVDGLTMTIIGPDPDGIVGRKIETLGIGDGVKKLDTVPYIDLPYYIRRADIGYALFPPNPLRTYAFPMKVIEYMAGGLAVIGTVGTETELVIKKYATGLVIPYRKDDYVRTVVDLFSRPNDIEKMAANGVKAASFYDWDTLMNDLLETLEEEFGKLS